MNNELKNIIKSLSGNVLGIGLDLELTKCIESNENILICNLLNDNSKTSKEGKKRVFFKGKTIKINKIRKKFKKKKVDYIICNYETIYPYLKTFVKDSVYINKTKLYFYGKIDIDFIESRYNRYDTKIKKYKNNIIEIDNTNSKNNFFKDMFYMIKDTITKLVEVIGDILMG